MNKYKKQWKERFLECIYCNSKNVGLIDHGSIYCEDCKECMPIVTYEVFLEQIIRDMESNKC